MSGCFIFSFIVAFQLNTQAQSSSNCFTDFNFYKNEGVGVLDNCHAGYFVRCYRNAAGIYKLVSNNIFGDHNDYIKTYQTQYIGVGAKDSFSMYTFQYLKEPLEGRLFRNANEKRFDTLLSTSDTLYFKKAHPNSIQLSEYFKLTGDTTCTVSFYYNDEAYSKKNPTFQGVNKWGSDQKYSGICC
jgi:hypothetical protein